MKPFNLEEALAGKPVVTKSGQKVIELHYFKGIDSKYECIIAQIEGYVSLERFYINGNYHFNQTSNFDLFMAEEKIEFWHNVYLDHFIKKFIISGSYDTESEALKYRNPSSFLTYIKTIKIDNQK